MPDSLNTDNKTKSESGEPIVSIVLAAYNCESTIERAVDSVIVQSMTAWELIIVDDCSTDKTADLIMRKYAFDKRINLIRLAKNGGPSVARNAGLAACKGIWITILDSDDAFAPERLHELLASANRYDLDFVADNLLYFDDHSRCTGGVAFAVRPPLEFISATDLFKSEMKNVGQLGFMKPLFKRSIITSRNIKYNNSLRFGEDFLIYVEMLIGGTRSAILSKALYIYTTQVGESSGVKSSSSHTRFTPFTRMTVSALIRKRYGSMMMPDELAAFEKYEAYVELYAYAHRMSESKNRRLYRSLLTDLIKHPKSGLRFILAQRPFRLIFKSSF